jgi:periplasmic copper chaperone A
VTHRLRRTALAVLVAIAAVLALGVGTASAHVSVSSPNAAPGGFGEITFSVPSESDTAKTTSLRVQLPTDTPFAFVSVKPVPGWTSTATTTAINPPLTDDDGNTVTEAVSEVTWTADAGGGLAPGEYQTFSISAGPLPEDADTLVFPALQGYDDGSTVSWIDPAVEGQPEPEHPAPTLGLTAAAGDPATGTATDTTATAPAASSDDSSNGLAVTALVVGIVGLLAGIAGVALALSARRRPVGDSAPAARDLDSTTV